MCQPILNHFNKHLLLASILSEKNFGSVNIDWATRKFHVRVHNESGQIVLSTGPLEMDAAANLSENELDAVYECIDGHFRLVAVAGTVLLAIVIKRFLKRKRTKHD